MVGQGSQAALARACLQVSFLTLTPPILPSQFSVNVECSLYSHIIVNRVASLHPLGALCIFAGAQKTQCFRRPLLFPPHRSALESRNQTSCVLPLAAVLVERSSE
jgi:hypothetical protein